MMPDAELIDFLKPYPLLEAVVAVIVATAIIGAALAIIYRAVRTANRNPDPYTPPQYYLSGPISQALDKLEGIYRILSEIRTDINRNSNDRRGDARENDREVLEVLRQIRERGIRR